MPHIIAATLLEQGRTELNPGGGRCAVTLVNPVPQATAKLLFQLMTHSYMKGWAEAAPVGQ